MREGQPDLFVHFSAIQAEGFKALYQDDKVSYEVSSTDGKEQAVNVTVVEKAKRPRHSGKRGGGKGVSEDADIE